MKEGDVMNIKIITKVKSKFYKLLMKYALWRMRLHDNGSEGFMKWYDIAYDYYYKWTEYEF
jgi:hypothetical protein